LFYILSAPRNNRGAVFSLRGEKYKGRKFGGGQAYDRSSDKTAVVA
jgi:hypothetical protein